MASYVAHQHFKPISDDYHQSQKASRGAGKITQTTIEQQWESQLINDAEFTAHVQLPSVTFDVNDSYVSQQLGQRVGEEVSHFYHPTPPRNVNGFWQGVDDVLKMREGTIKAAELMFTGRYQAPRDSWETAGFMIEAPIALSSLAEAGVERLGAEAIETLYQGSQQLGKGLIQASRLMNRWGVFSKNGAESLETLANRDLNHVRSVQNEFSVKSPNAAEASSVKYRALEAAQNKAVKSEILDDGRIRYYKNEIPAKKPGPTRGAAYVTEYNPKTGDVYTWMESYDQLGNVNRIHPKMYNGQELHAPHYPLTLKDKIETELYSSCLRR